MADYKETQLAGTAWNRCCRIEIDNVRGNPPAILFYEERVIALEDGQEIRQSLGPLQVGYAPGRVIPLLDPATGQPSGGETTYAAAYAIIYSAYLSAAMARDALITPPAPPADQPA